MFGTRRPLPDKAGSGPSFLQMKPVRQVFRLQLPSKKFPFFFWSVVYDELQFICACTGPFELALRQDIGPSFSKTFFDRLLYPHPRQAALATVGDSAYRGILHERTPPLIFAPRTSPLKFAPRTTTRTGLRYPIVEAAKGITSTCGTTTSSCAAQQIWLLQHNPAASADCSAECVPRNHRRGASLASTNLTHLPG